jgi:hypothetical protein
MEKFYGTMLPFCYTLLHNLYILYIKLAELGAKVLPFNIY